MRILLTLIVFAFLTSCATTLNHKTYPLKVISTKNSDKVIVNDKVYSLPAKIDVKRSNADLTLRLISDTTTKDYKVRSSPNAKFVYGNLLWMQVCPAAYLIDLTNQKRFYYGRSIRLNVDDSVTVITPRVLRRFENHFAKKFPRKKGDVNLSVSFPHVNSFYFQPENEPVKVNTGFWGLSLGFEYYYKDNRYISLKANAVSDLFIPVPAPIDISGEYELMKSTYLSLTNNNKINRLHFGYGINFSRNTWDLRNSDRFDPQPPTRAPVKKSSNSFGFTFQGYYQLTRTFLAGVVYRPTIFKISPTAGFEYEHLISLDVGWRFSLKK